MRSGGQGGSCGRTRSFSVGQCWMGCVPATEDLTPLTVLVGPATERGEGWSRWSLRGARKSGGVRAKSSHLATTT